MASNDWDSVTYIGRPGPKAGSSLKKPGDVLAAQKKGLAVVTESKCNSFDLT